MAEPVKRAYDGSRRRAAAEATRRAVLAAAGELFAEGGYASTSVQAVADRAEVSLDTVYASVGRKPQLLLAVHDASLAEGPIPVPAEHVESIFLPLARQRSPGRKKGGLTRSGKGPGAVLRREAPPPRPAGFPHPSGAVGFDVGQACHGFVATAFLGLHEGLQAVDLGLQAGDHDGMLRGL